jgi:transposase
LRILLIGYLYGVTSERKLVEELRMHLAWRWFTGLGFDQEIPHHSTFSKNRHGRFQESKLFEQLVFGVNCSENAPTSTPFAGSLAKN